ncbi:MAG: alpha/beta fold hydrolase [Dehalococcoidia bacterium]
MPEALADTYRVYAYDLRGHGDSEWAVGGTYGATELLIDLVAVLELIDQPVRIVAHSIGATTALIAAACFPERITRIVTIEDAGPRIDDVFAEHSRDRLKAWVQRMQGLRGRESRVYSSLAEAAKRTAAANPRRFGELVQHLTRWGARDVEPATWRAASRGSSTRALAACRAWT